MRVLVTGIGGFAGPYVAAALRARQHEVLGTVRRAPGPRLAALGLAPEALYTVDVTDAARVADVVSAAMPDAVLHLAGVAFVPAAEDDPLAAYRVNVLGTLAVLAAVRARAPRARLLAVSSGDVYGDPGASTPPLDEAVPLRPRSVYGASKAAADLAAAQWARAYGLDVVRARPFNHTGPGQDPGYVCSAIARQLAAIELGRQAPVLEVGNVDPVRDFSDVRDIAAGYVTLLERGRTGEVYNLCSGEGVSIAEVIALLRARARVPVRVRSDPARRRANDPPRIVASHSRATAQAGWCPQLPLADTLTHLLDDWRTRLAAES